MRCEWVQVVGFHEEDGGWRETCMNNDYKHVFKKNYKHVPGIFFCKALNNGVWITGDHWGDLG